MTKRRFFALAMSTPRMYARSRTHRPEGKNPLSRVFPTFHRGSGGRNEKGGGKNREIASFFRPFFAGSPPWWGRRGSALEKVGSVICLTVR